MTKLFSTSRGVREFYASYKGKNELLPKAITIADFESRALYVEDRTFIDNDNRLLLLRDATNFDKYEKLQFSSEFMTFLSHSQYIFSFFDELSSEEIEIENLKDYDTYALYDEHLEALEILKRRYITLLDQNSFVDRINLKDHYKINEDYLKNLGSVELELDGFLSRFEINLFQKCAKVIPFYINLELNIYNQKLLSIFENIGFKLDIGNRYRLNLGKKNISTCRALEKKTIKADTEVFQTRLSQVGFVFSSIQGFVEDGLSPSDIAVVLPDESLVPYLKEFDEYKNLNFAMGFSLKNSFLYKRIEAIELYIQDKNDESKMRINRLSLEDNMLQNIQIKWRKKQDFDVTISVLNDILNLDEKESSMTLFQEEMFKFSNLLSRLERLTMEQSFRLFLKRLKDVKEDDVRGGKITVMGLLETRGSVFKGVVVPDFSDDFVPRYSNKDLFLNADIRKNAGLPTREDRENLQRYYYHRLFENAKQIAISTVANESTMPSRFLDELKINYDSKRDTQVYNTLLFGDIRNYTAKAKELKNVSYMLDSEVLSATKLDTLLTCRRKFYFRYIEKLGEAKNPLESSNAQLGLKLHKALERVFVKNLKIKDEIELLILLRRELLVQGVSELEEFELESWLVLLKTLVSNEKRRYDEGYRIYANELTLDSSFEGFRISGKIDRIDIKEGLFSIIDYKSGDIGKLIRQKIDNMKNFQLEFYYLLASTLGRVGEVSYYDLKNAKLHDEPMLEEKIEQLKRILNKFKKPITNFDMCEKKSSCTFCPYKKLCLVEQ